MSHRDPATRAGELEVSPWPFLLAGLGLVGLCWPWGLVADGLLPILRVMSLATGLTAIGISIAVRVRNTPPGLESRLYTAAVWGLGAAAAYIGQFALGTQFDSMTILLHALVLAGAAGAIITALPPGYRLVFASVLILLHFAAILTAVTVVPPPNGPSPFLSNQVWSRWARPYLQLTVLNNGYHFYAPEPGPAALMWFRVQFEDGSSTWTRFPDHDKVGTHLERRRLGALATTVGMTEPVMGPREEELFNRRVHAAQVTNIPLSDLPFAAQYRQPTIHAMLLIASYAKRAAKTTAHPEGANSPVKAVKVYRVDYMNPPVQHFQAGREPLDPTLYIAYYMGEFDKEGRLSPACLTIERDPNDGRVTKREQDPFLYWQLPIVRIMEEGAQPEVGPSQRPGVPGVWSSTGKIINYVRIHAGDKKDQESIP